MKVLQINSVCGIGSTGRIATDIHNILIEKGHESYIAYGRGLAKNCNNSIRIGGKLNNYNHVVLTRVFDKHGFGSKKATLDFIDEIKNLNPDIIHLHNIHGYFLNIEILFKYLSNTNKPIVWTLHDCWAFTGHCSYFDFVGCTRWKKECYECPQKKSYPTSLFIDNSKENYYRKKRLFSMVKNMTIITPSDWLAGLIKESFLREHKVKVINNGIDLETFKFTTSEFREKHNLINKFIILGVANIWEKRKGYDYFMELSKKIENDEIIVLVGLTENQKKNLPGNVIGITRTNSIKELAEIYSASDVFVNPTLEDNFPTTNLEALACGTPVITFNTGGSIEAIDDKTGFLVEKGNIKELILKLKEIKMNGKKVYFNNCVERARNLYNKNIKYLEYISLYNDINE